MARSALESHAHRIIRELRSAGYESWLVGGCVRDHLLGIEPHDYDVATAAPPDTAESILSGVRSSDGKSSYNIHGIGRAFGVLLVVRSGAPELQVEVATFRSDGAYLDGRRPTEVHFSTAEEDAKRRDFTINGMFMNPESGEILDLVGGQRDLKAKMVRAIGEPIQRFTEDKLRMLRAIRFACRFGFAIDPPTSDAVRELAPQLSQVSAERICAELHTMFVGRDVRSELQNDRIVTTAPGRALRELLEHGLLATALPELDATIDRDGGAALARTAASLDLVAPMLREPFRQPNPALSPEYAPSPAVAWAILLHGAGHSEARSALRRLKHSTDMIKSATSLVERLDEIGKLFGPDGPTVSMAEFKRWMRQPGTADLLVMERVLALADRGLGRPDADARLKLAQHAWSAFLQLAGTDGLRGLTPPSLIAGEDVIAAGVPPGPRVKVILRRVEDAILEGRVQDRSQAIAMIQQLIDSGATT